MTLINTGARRLSIAAITIGGVNGGDFSETNKCGAAVAAGACCTVQVIFTPTASGIRTASLFVAANFSGVRAALDLTGTGVVTGPTPGVQAIVDSWGYTAGVAPGLWVTIMGTNLARSPESWNLNGVQELPVVWAG